MVNQLISGREKVTVHTPPTDGSILPGITRDSILQLLPEYFPEVEIDVSDMHIDRFKQMHEDGQLIGSFVSGTASVVGKVRSILVGEKVYAFDYSQHNHVENIKKMLTDIQHGFVPHRFSTMLH